jgi:hypothetical protein
MCSLYTMTFGCVVPPSTPSGVVGRRVRARNHGFPSAVSKEFNRHNFERIKNLSLNFLATFVRSTNDAYHAC